MSDELLYSPDPVEVDFLRRTAESLYLKGAARIVNPLRWERARKDIRFEDVVFDVTKRSGSRSISCPFHGRDSHPSFFFYPRNNDGTCFGCPPGKRYYDNIIIVARSLDMTNVQALRWIENKYNLPPIADTEGEDDEPVTNEVVRELRCEDLIDPFIRLARTDIQNKRDPELAGEYLRVFFEADNLNQKNSSAEDRAKAAMLLGEVLGKKRLKGIKSKKAY